jgi:hypothetical protein
VQESREETVLQHDGGETKLELVLLVRGLGSFTFSIFLHFFIFVDLLKVLWQLLLEYFQAVCDFVFLELKFVLEVFDELLELLNLFLV